MRNPFKGTGFNGYTAMSPVGMVLVAFLLCLASVSVPKDHYELIMNEPNLMSGNWKMVSAYGLACLCFLGGFFLLGGNSQNPRLSEIANARAARTASTQNKLYHIPPLIVVAALNAISMLIILKNTPGLIALVLSGEGEAAKQVIDTTGSLAGVQPLLLAGIWWAMGRHLTIFDDLKTQPAKISALVIAASLFIAVLFSIIKVARYEVIPLLIGSLIVYLVVAIRRKQVNMRQLFVFAGSAAVAVLVIFMAFSMIRGHTSDYQMQKSLYGYGPTAFNHFAAVIDGRLTFPYAGTGTYTFSWLSNPPFIHKIVDFRSMFGLPDATEVFRTEFDASRNAGLARSYNWVTAVGYYYQDWGQGVYLFMAIMGALACILWKQALKGGTAGLVLYPFMASTILLWCGYAGFTKPTLMTYLMAAAGLSLYDLFFARRRRNDLQESVVARGNMQEQRQRERIALHPRPNAPAPRQRPRR